MTDCTNIEIRDALPDLLHGRLGQVDTATMLAHVEACAACSAELAMLRAIRDSAALAPKIDVDRIVAALPAGPRVPVQAEPTRPLSDRRGVVSVAWKLAAAVAVIVTGAVVLDRPDTVTTTVPPSVASTPAAERAAPSVAQTNTVGSTAVAPAMRTSEGTSLSLVAGVQDLSDEQIETLLAELDQIESIPSAEPELEPVTIDGVESEG